MAAAPPGARVDCRGEGRDGWRVDYESALAAAVSTERTRVIATLARRFGLDLAEESFDAATEAALVRWPREGVPESPRAWLLTVARRRAIDRVRHRVTADEVHASLRVASVDEGSLEADLAAANLPDDQLRLLFTCCHPALAREAQVALALRWLSGLSTEDVARAFCVAVPTMAQRLTRARSKIELARIPYEVPERSELGARVDAVLEVVYAIFNEGYVATSGDALARVDLVEESLRLAELVVRLMPDRPAPRALLALLLLVHARRAARVSVDGELVPLEEQDRGAWDRAAIARGKRLLEEALASGPADAYAIEAAIQALHDEAPSWAETDFRQIALLYRMLRERTDAPVVALNEAVARSYVHGPELALDEVLALERAGDLAGHPALPAAKGDILRRLGRVDEARAAYDEAMAATKNHAERRFLARRRAGLAG